MRRWSGGETAGADKVEVYREGERDSVSSCMAMIESMATQSRPEPAACAWATADCCSSDAGERIVGDLTWFRVGLALAFSGQGMVFGLGYNNAYLAGEAPPYGSGVYWALHGGLLFSALAVVGLLGMSLARSTVASIRARQVTVEGLFLLTATGALVASILSSLRGEGSVYYEVVGLVLVIYTVGRKVGATTRGKALAATSLWRESFGWAQVETAAGNRRRVAVDRLRPEDVVVVLPGEAITVDGVILEGFGEVRETIVSGELLPVAKGIGAPVHAGSYAVDGRLRIAPQPAGTRTLDRILATIEGAVARPSRFQTQADRLMRGFLPFVVAVSGTTFAGWWLAGAGWPQALFHAMAVLLVACPCALGLATPIAIWTGLLTLSRRGLVSRDGSLLEALAHSRTWLFDKTGTLSEAHPEVAAFERMEGAPGEAWLRRAVASLEAQVSHPLAEALRRLSTERVAVESVRVVPGRGVEGMVEGKRLRVGRIDWLATPVSSSLAESRGIGVEVDGRFAAGVALREALGATSAETLRALKASGAEVRILSGDPAPEHAAIGDVPVEGDLSPEAKVAIVREHARRDPLTVFVGDGLNDAAALAAAPLGIALAGGASLTQAGAAGVLMGGRLEVLPWAVAFARHLQARLRGNLLFALAYNLIGITLAASGWLHPVVAALLMVGSSVVVSWRAAQVGRWAEERLLPPPSAAPGRMK
jgi:heavy metal translocating P-type ATPase